MSSETALVVVIALLWGPTMLWLLFRLARGQNSHREFGTRDEPASTVQTIAPAAADLNELVDAHGFWLCGSCKSLNRREAKKCYACRTERGRPAPGPATTPDAPVAVPVMNAATTWTAVGPGHSAPSSETVMPVAAATAATAPGASAAAAPGTAATTTPVIGEPGRPVVAATDARAEAETAAAAAIVAGAQPRPIGPGDNRGVPVPTSHPAEHGQLTAPSYPADLPAPAPGPMPGAVKVGAADAGSRAAPRTGLAVCPFVGLDADPSTWFDFPDPNNVCHAIPADDGSMLGSFLRMVGARPSARELDADTQQSWCLTEAHRECARYLAAMSVLAVPGATEVTNTAAQSPAAPLPDEGASGTGAEPAVPTAPASETWMAHQVVSEPAGGNGAYTASPASAATEPRTSDGVPAPDDAAAPTPAPPTAAAPRPAPREEDSRAIQDEASPETPHGASAATPDDAPPATPDGASGSPADPAPKPKRRKRTRSSTAGSTRRTSARSRSRSPRSPGS